MSKPQICHLDIPVISRGEKHKNESNMFELLRHKDKRPERSVKFFVSLGFLSFFPRTFCTYEYNTDEAIQD